MDAVRLAGLFAERLNLDGPPDPVSLATHPDLGRVDLTVDARAESASVQSAWVHLAAEIAEAARNLPRTTRPTLWVTVAPTVDAGPYLPRTDVNFRHRWWWGVLRPVDTIVAAEDAGLDAEVAACAVEIVRWDLDLFERLAGWDGTTAGLAGRLETEVVGDPIVFDGGTLGMRPTDALLDSWSVGLVESWDGRVSTHVMVESQVRADAFARGIWAGQVSRVLPFIELERYRLAEWLAGEVAAVGPTDEWAATDIAGLEIGPLWACLNAHGRVGAPQSRVNLLRDLRDARNAIAHRQPIAPATLSSLRSRADQDRRA